MLIFGGHGFDLTYLTGQLCGGGLMLGAFFMATDYVTSPITKTGQIVYGVILGILTGLFRVLFQLGGRSILCDYFLQPAGSFDRKGDFTQSIW